MFPSSALILLTSPFSAPGINSKDATLSEIAVIPPALTVIIIIHLDIVRPNVHLYNSLSVLLVVSSPPSPTSLYRRIHHLHFPFGDLAKNINKK